MGAMGAESNESEQVLLEDDEQHANEPDTDQSDTHVAPSTAEEQTVETPKPITGLSNHPTLAEHYDLPESYAELVREYLEDTSPMTNKGVEISPDEIEEILENISEILSAPLGSHIFIAGLESVIALVKKAEEHAASKFAADGTLGHDESE